MRNIVRKIGAGLASMAGVLMVSGVAWAQAEETPIQGEWRSCQSLEEPEREWVDEDGIEHRRDALYSCMHRGSLRGLEKGWANQERDPGVWVSERGYYAYTGFVLGETNPGVGRYTLECSRIEGVMTCV
jgi:hypothetical protein